MKVALACPDHGSFAKAGLIDFGSPSDCGFGVLSGEGADESVNGLVAIARDGHILKVSPTVTGF